MSKILATVITNENPAADEYGLVVRPIGGSGGGDVTIVAPIPLPVTIADEPVEVDIVSSINLPVTGPLTDAELRAAPVEVEGTVSINQPIEINETYVTASGNITANGQNVTLSLEGRKSASVQFTSTGWSGSFRFYTSNNGVTFTECQAVRPFSWDVVSRLGPAMSSGTSAWIFCLAGGETHVRVESVSFVGGSMAVLIVGSPAPADPIMNSMGAQGDNNAVQAGVVIAGRRDTGCYPIAARADNQIVSSVGLVVRNAAGYESEAAPSEARGYMVSGYDATPNVAIRLRVRDEDPISSDFGLITRNIPSGTQPVSGPLTDAELRATPVPVSGTVSVNEPVTVDGTVSTKTPLTPAAPVAVSVGVASTQILATNAARKGAAIVNTSAARISLGLDAPAVLDSGITLFPGGSFVMDEYTFTTGIINGIASAAASNAGAQEYA